MNGKCSKIPPTLPLSACSADIPAQGYGFAHLSEGDRGHPRINILFWEFPLKNFLDR